MTRYFFDVVADGDIHSDDVGVLLSSREDLADAAVKKAGNLIQAITQERKPDWWLMEVRNDHQEIVGRVSLVVSGFDGAMPASES